MTGFEPVDIAASSATSSLLSTAVLRFFAAATKTRLVTPNFLFDDRWLLWMEQPLQITNILGFVRLDANPISPNMLF